MGLYGLPTALDESDAVFVRKHSGPEEFSGRCRCWCRSSCAAGLGLGEGTAFPNSHYVEICIAKELVLQRGARCKSITFTQRIPYRNGKQGSMRTVHKVLGGKKTSGASSVLYLVGM